MKFYLIYKNNGLYDPVLDDQEPIYEYEPGDLDQALEPSEVPFKIQQFIEPPELGSRQLDFDTPSIIPTPNTPAPESRSLTASPFVTPTKPYRPFSTEPIPEVPPLEDPIILNPDYRDQFGKSPIDSDPDYLLNAHFKNGLEGSAGFKLPISEQYDPDGTRFVQNVEVVDKLLKYERHVKCLSKDLSVVDVTKERRVSEVVSKDVKEKLSSNVKITESLSKDVKFSESLSKDVKTSQSVSTDVKTVESAVGAKTADISKVFVARKSLQDAAIEIKDLKITEKITLDIVEKDTRASTESKEVISEEMEEKLITEELEYIDKMKQVSDIEKIEKTAITVVDDSIERAVSVTEEIKKEMLEEMSSSEIESKTEMTSESVEEKKMSAKTVEESSEIQKSDVKMTDRKISKEETSDTIQALEKHIAKDTTEALEEVSETVSKKDIKKSVQRQSLVSEQYEAEEMMQKPERKQSVVEQTKSYAKSEDKSEYSNVTRTVTSGATTETKEAEQRAYAIGLQTIPNIRGVVHSSYHYDLLLRTFFLHLTDVMVALSRFLLSQPIFSGMSEASVTKSQTYQSEMRAAEARMSQEVKEASKKVDKQEVKQVVVEAKKQTEVRDVVQPAVVKQDVKVVSQKIETEIKAPVVVEKKEVQAVVAKDVKQEMKIESVQAAKVEKIEVVKPVVVEQKKQEIQLAKIEADKTEIKQEIKVEKTDLKEEQKLEKVELAVISDEKKAITGSQMAQRTEKKLSEEITQKMDAVISEFQTIAVEEDVKKEMLQRNRRSRSRSQIEEEVMREGDPLDWLEKLDSRRASQERTEISHISKKEFSASEQHSASERKTTETHRETRHKKSKTPKQMYVAVVEAHVYTNKDAIFEEQIEELSETSSVQSAEEISTAIESIEAISTENVALETALRELETAKIVTESNKMATATAKSEATVQKMEEITHASKAITQEDYKKETAIKSSAIQDVVIHETKEVIEPVVEIKETKLESEKISVDINESLFIAQSTEVSTHESKSEFTSTVKKEEIAAIIEEDYRQSTVKESKAEVLKAEQEAVQIEDVTEMVLKFDKQDKKTVQDENAALKIITEVATEIESTNEIIEIEELTDKSLTAESVISKVEMSKEIEMDASKQVIEKSFVSKEIGMAAESNHIATSVSISKASEISETKSEEVIQEASFTARSVDKKLTLRTDLGRQISSGPPTTIDTPTPATVPPTPLTDEYVFKLTIPLPKSRSTTPVPRDGTLSPEDEDPHIVKKKLIPHIETQVEQSIIYDPPLPTPPVDRVQSPVYTKPGLLGGGLLGRKRFPIYRKPGLFGGADKPEYTKEEIREIERKSSLLASAIDETIKSIEEYKEEVGIETKKEVKVTEFKEEKVIESYEETYTEKTIIESPPNGKDHGEIKIEEIVEKINEVTMTNGNGDVSVGIVEEFESKKEVIDTSDNKRKESIETMNIQISATDNKEEKSVNIEVTVDDKVEEVETEVCVPKTIESEVKITEIVEDVPAEICEPKPVETVVKLTDKIEEVKAEECVAKPIENDMKIQEDNKEIKKEVVEDKLEAKQVYECVQTKTEVPRIEKAEQIVEVTKVVEEKEKSDTLPGFRPVVFDPAAIPKRAPFMIPEPPGTQEPRQSPYMTDSGEILGTIQGIVDGLEDPVMDEEVAKELGKPGISEEKIAELISGEAEMLREAHVMGLSRVLTSHMSRPDDSSVDFQKIKPLLDSLKDSEVLKALNEEMARQKAEEKKKEEKRWTTFLQKPKRAVPSAKFGYHGWTEAEIQVAEPYKVKIVKQAKPKVAPDYKPEDFDTGPLPWEERAVLDSTQPPVEPEEPILIPEVPEFFEAVDPLKESEVPDLEDTGIPLPPPREPTPPPVVENHSPLPETEVIEELPEEETAVEEKKESREDMENRLADQLVKSVQGMVDPNATVDQQLSQMRAQLAALAQLPEVIQQTLALVSNQLNKMTQQETQVSLELSVSHTESSQEQQIEVTQNTTEETQAIIENNIDTVNEEDKMTIEEVHDQTEMMVKQQQEQEMMQQMAQEQERMEMKTPVITEEEIRMEKQKKDQARLEFESRQIKQHPTPRATKPKKVFGPLDPEERMQVVLPGGRRWKGTQDVYNEQMFAETMKAQAELIQGKALGINFMKYEKPPVSLEHLKHSEVFKLVHDMDQPPLKRVEMRTPVIAEADYRERCRSNTPSTEKKHQQIPQQFHP